jgi:hypothetical protein
MIAIDARQKALMDHEHRQLWRLIAQVWDKLAARCELLELPISPQTGTRRVTDDAYRPKGEKRPADVISNAVQVMRVAISN